MSIQPDSGQAGRPSELRLAVAFTGDASLAVWMGGMTREMNLLASASWVRRGEALASSGSPGGRQLRDHYQTLLELLDMDCSIDILAGNGAGGISAAILGVANARRLDLEDLRDLWFQEGCLERLLRSPEEKNPPSLLRGDAVLSGLRTFLARLSATPQVSADTDGRPGTDCAEDPIKVFMTATLLTGRYGCFIDEYGTLVRGADHQGLFAFGSEDLVGSDLSALALAMRCSGSSPAVFEPALIPVGTTGGDGYPDMRRLTNATQTQFATDRGGLASPWLDRILQTSFDRLADHDVRRVLAYVAPSAGTPRPLKVKPTSGDTPGLSATLSGELDATLSQRISADLAAIRAQNQKVRARRDARHELARLAMTTPQLAARLYPTYRERRAANIAETAADEVFAQLVGAPPATDGRPAGFGADAGHARAVAKRAAHGRLPTSLPGPGDFDGMNAAGREALEDAKAAVSTLLSISYRLLPMQARPQLGALRGQATRAMPWRSEPTVTEIVAAVPAVRQAAGITLSAAPRAAADAAVALLAANMTTGTAQQSWPTLAAPEAISPQPWRELAEVVLGLRDLLAAVRTASGPDGAFVHDVLDYLTLPESYTSPDTVAARLFGLHVARYVLQPDSLAADEEIELVQMSSDTRTRLDPRTLAEDKLTGLQLHHFGAFYKNSWCANDWMWGRLDAAGWLVYLLLDPRRLRRLANEAPDPRAFVDELKSALRNIAGEDAPPGVWDPFPAVGNRASDAAEMAFLTAQEEAPLPPSLPWTSMWVAAGLQRLIAGEELSHVAQQIERDAGRGASESAASAFVTAYRKATAGSHYPPVPTAHSADVLRTCQVSAETFTGEINSPMLTRTITQAASVTMQMIKLPDYMTTPLFLINSNPIARLVGSKYMARAAAFAAATGPGTYFVATSALGLVILGALASTSAIGTLSAVGAFTFVSGVLIAAAAIARSIRIAVALFGLASATLLIAGGFIPAIRNHFFPWLEATALPGLARHPVLWGTCVVLLFLPCLWLFLEIIQKGWDKRSRGSH